MNGTDVVAELTSAIPKPLQIDLLNKRSSGSEAGDPQCAFVLHIARLTRDAVPRYCASAMGCTGEYSADDVQMQSPVLSGEPVILKITSKKS